MRPERQTWGALSHSLRDVSVSGERIKMEKEADPEGAENDAEAVCPPMGIMVPSNR